MIGLTKAIGARMHFFVLPIWSTLSWHGDLGSISSTYLCPAFMSYDLYYVPKKFCISDRASAKSERTNDIILPFCGYQKLFFII